MNQNRTHQLCNTANLDGGSFAELIDEAYNEIVKWRKKLLQCQLALKKGTC